MARAEIRTSALVAPDVVTRHNHHHAWVTRPSCQLCRMYAGAYVDTRPVPELEPLLDVWGGTYTEREVTARLAEIRRENARYGRSDDRVTEGDALWDALERFRAQRLEDSNTHAPCPTHQGQHFHRSTGACSCGAAHR